MYCNKPFHEPLPVFKQDPTQYLRSIAKALSLECLRDRGEGRTLGRGFAAALQPRGRLAAAQYCIILCRHMHVDAHTAQYYTHIYIHIYICIYIYTYIYIYIYIHMYVCTYTQVHIHTYVYLKEDIYIYTHAHTHTHTHVNQRVSIHMKKGHQGFVGSLGRVYI